MHIDLAVLLPWEKKTTTRTTTRFVAEFGEILLGDSSVVRGWRHRHRSLGAGDSNGNY